ncbi:MAG: DUF5668 domain-containing protein [Anaerolineales bacterium]|jgi:hypothetical protein
MDNNRNKRSLFWPVVLIGVGIVWMLYNLNLISGANLSAALQLWPLLLIGIGMDLLFGRRFPIVSALIGLVVVGGILGMTLAGPRLGLVSSPELTTETFVAPSGLARRARLEVQFSTGDNQIRPLAGTQNLLVATAIHSGTVEFTDSGTTNRNVRLSGPRPESGVFIWPSFMGEQSWDVAISPDVPVDLELGVSSGNTNVDLSGLKVESTSVQVSSGDTTVILPATGKSYRSVLRMSSGSLTVSVQPGAETILESRISSGRLTYDLPVSSPVRFEVTRKSSGTVRLPERFQLVSGQANGEGVWEAPGSDPSAPLIEITVEISSGNVIVR